MIKFTAIWLLAFFYTSVGVGCIFICACFSRLCAMAVKRAIEAWAEISGFKSRFIDYHRNRRDFEKWREWRDTHDEA